MKQNEKKPNIVLVHGAWADGSCWSGVIKLLQEDGYNVIAPQFPRTRNIFGLVFDRETQGTSSKARHPSRR